MDLGLEIVKSVVVFLICNFFVRMCIYRNSLNYS